MLRLTTTMTLAGLLVFWGIDPSIADDLRIDGSSKAAFDKSSRAVADSVPPEDKDAFEKGFISLIISRYPPAAGAEGFVLLSFMAPALEAAPVTMDGVSKDEILEKGRELLAGTVKPNDIKARRSCLQKKVTLSASKIERLDDSDYAVMSVTNTLPWPISDVYVAYKVTSQGRSVPWDEGDFLYRVNGGIEPGETRQIDYRTGPIPKGATNLSLAATVLDVADAEKRHFVGEFLGLLEQLAPSKCE